jgi:hypothetical protein
MADKKEKAAKPAKAAKAKGSKKGGRLKLLIITLIVAGCAVPAIGLIVLAGMIPSIVMGLTDRSHNKALSVCVSAPNAAGCLQAIIMMLPRGLSIEGAMNLLMQPETFLVMWGSAALGLGLFTFIPPLIAGVLASMAELKIGRLRHNQKELKRIWGDDVVK